LFTSARVDADGGTVSIVLSEAALEN